MIAELITPDDVRLMRPEELAEIETLLIAEESEQLAGDFRAYIEAAWPIVEPETDFVPGWHIDAIADHLTAVTRGEIRKLLINVPPGHMKSLETCVFWPTWEWTRTPELRSLFASYGEEFATRDSVKSRRIVQSDWYQDRWGDRVHLASDQNLKKRYENTATGYRISGGLTLTGERGDRLVVDDPHDIREIHSEAARKAVLEWWDQVMSQRGRDPKTVAKVIIMQRLHEEDLSGHVLQEGGWTHLCLPAEYERAHPFVYVHDPRKEEGELLWPQRFGAVEIAQLKIPLGSYGVAGQFQQRPSPAGGGMVKRAWWKFYTEVPADLDQVIQSWDCAFKDTDGSDYVVGTVWGKKGANRYLLDLVRDRMDFPTTCRAIETMSSKWPAAAAKLVEDKANGTAVIATLKNRIPGLIPVEPQGGKEARLAAVSPTIEAGNVWLPAGAAFVEDFLGEFTAFPKGAHDDQVDSTTQALLRFHTDGIFEYYSRKAKGAAA